eukprot:8809194-Pyramimonas_sp.AAC.1
MGQRYSRDSGGVSGDSGGNSGTVGTVGQWLGPWRKWRVEPWWEQCWGQWGQWSVVGAPVRTV